MNHLWLKSTDGTYEPIPLDGAAVSLSGDGPRALPAPAALDMAAPILVRHHGANGEERWTLLCAASGRVRVNGRQVRAGVRVLADRDAISLAPGQTLWFSSEDLARVAQFPATDSETCCIRCKLPLETDTPAVRCPAPGCGFWHHQSEDLPCWTAAPGCAACGHPTDFDAGFQWSPAGL